MRTIKFRGKRIVNGDWIYGDLFREIALTPTSRKRKSEFSGFWAIQTETPDGIKSYSVDQETIGQFTGLQDSNGQEIYEGDILTWRSIICEEDPVATWELPVTFYNGCFCVNDDFDMTLISVIYDSEEFGGVKIIGNIHDNPELMEGGKNE